VLQFYDKIENSKTSFGKLLKCTPSPSLPSFFSIWSQDSLRCYLTRPMGCGSPTVSYWITHCYDFPFACASTVLVSFLCSLCFLAICLVRLWCAGCVEMANTNDDVWRCCLGSCRGASRAAATGRRGTVPESGVLHHLSQHYRS
jgi:hypothetical protein